MSGVKYLYGKKKFLNQLIDGKGIIRFDPISAYSLHENEKIRDDEKNKVLIFNKENTRRLEVDFGFIKKIYEPTNNDCVELVVEPVDCFCKCLSNTGYCGLLYERFNADICIEIDIDKLVKSIEAVFLRNYPTIRVAMIIGNVRYYDSIKDWPDRISTLESVFYKPDSFQIENEYRIALAFENKDISKSRAMDISVPERSSDYYYVMGYKDR